VTFISATGGQIGAAQTEVWRFKSVGKGTTKLTFSYVQPFDKTTPAAQTMVFTVNIN
jgi:predicted secreted protein